MYMLNKFLDSFFTNGRMVFLGILTFLVFFTSCSSNEEFSNPVSANAETKELSNVYLKIDSINNIYTASVDLTRTPGTSATGKAVKKGADYAGKVVGKWAGKWAGAVAGAADRKSVV